MAKRPSSRFCSDRCRKRASRNPGLTLIEFPRPGLLLESEQVLPVARQELQEAGKADTLLGRSALALAARIDQGVDSGASLAALVKVFDAVIGKALGESERGDTPLDVLRRRRIAARRDNPHWPATFDDDDGDGFGDDGA